MINTSPYRSIDRLIADVRKLSAARRRISPHRVHARCKPMTSYKSGYVSNDVGGLRRLTGTRPVCRPPAEHAPAALVLVVLYIRYRL